MYINMRTVFILVFLVASTQAFDNIFWNCTSVEFCNNLRGQSANDDTKLTISGLKDTACADSVCTVKLQKKDGTKYVLELTGLADSTYRLIVKEEDSKRYKLKIVLDGDPKTIQLDKKLSDNQVKIFESGKTDAKDYVVIHSEPLQIEFFKNEKSVVLLDGEKLILDKVTDNTEPFAFSVQFPQATQIYGIHEHADSLALRTTEDQEPYRLRNLDVANHPVDTPLALYGAIPVLYGHGTSATSGIFLHNAAQQWYDIKNGEKASAQIMVESALLDLFVFLGPSPKDVVQQYTTLTGKAHLPQIWALGYHQCRWNYDNQSDVKDVLANLDSHNFQVDVMWLDIEYTDGKKYFTWNPETFSDPLEMQTNISASGRKLVTIIDPHIKVDDSYEVYKGAKDAGLFVTNSSGNPFEGDCWPGLSSYMDFLNPKARDYYADRYQFKNFPKSTATLAGIWNDMNEPSVFDDSIEKTLPWDAKHTDDDDTTVLHRDIHNIYGFLHTMSTHKGLMNRDENKKRPFILTRSHFAGSQRFAAIWTGDNTAKWEYLAVSYAECLNANILGLVFCGADVGGFFDDPDVELLQRWYQAAAWTPFYRQHANQGTPRREPYLYNEDVQAVIREAIQIRYKHIPFWYTTFYEHTRTGAPVIRPLFYEYPSDDKVFSISNQLLVGSDILVRAVQEPGVTNVTVYFPGDKTIWYSMYDGEHHIGPKEEEINVTIASIPVYYRGGSIIARKDLHRKCTADMVNDCYTIVINLDQDGKAAGNIYVDDLTSFKYQDKEYTYVRYEYDAATDFIKESDIDPDATGNFEIFVCDVVINKVEDGNYQQKSIKLSKSTKISDGLKLHS